MRKKEKEEEETDEDYEELQIYDQDDGSFEDEGER